MNLEFNSPTCYRGSSNNLNLKVFNQLYKILFKKVTQLHFKVLDTVLECAHVDLYSRAQTA